MSDVDVHAFPSSVAHQDQSDLAVGLRFLNAVPHCFGTLQDLLTPCLDEFETLCLQLAPFFDQRSTLMLGGRAFFFGFQALELSQQ